MKIHAYPIIVAIACQTHVATCFGQGVALESVVDKGKPVWWYKLKQCDLCIRASSVTLDESRKEFLMDSDKRVIAEYIPVKLKVDHVLFASPRMDFDGRFVKDNKSKLEIGQKFSEQLEIFLIKKIAGPGAEMDSHFMGDKPSLPTEAIFTLVKSGHKKDGEFVISSYVDVGFEAEYLKAVRE